MSIELFNAIRENNINLVRELIAAKPHIINQIYQHYHTPLYDAIVNNNPNMDIIRELITAGADVNMFITINKNPPIMKLTPLMIVVTKGNVNLVRALIDAGADVNLKDPTLNETALNKIFQDYTQEFIIYDDIFITQNNMLIIMNMLLDAGANVNEQGFYKTTPLMNICTAQDISIPPNNNIFDKKIFINALLERGANINLQNSVGNTALMSTIGMLDENLINNYKTIINDAYHPIQEEEFYVQKDLYIAHFVDLIKFLLSKGANVLLENNNGETALDIAIKVKVVDKEIIDILIRAENIYKKRIAIDAYMRSRNKPYLPPTNEHPLSGFYHSNIDDPDNIMEQVLNMAYDEEENEGAEESKSNRGDARGKRRKSVRKRSVRKKSKSKRRKSIRKKVKSQRVKRRKSIRK